MIFDIKEHVDGIVEASSRRERVEHMWLHGFHSIVDGALLDIEKAERHICDELNNYPFFTRLRSSTQYSIILRDYLVKHGLDVDSVPEEKVALDLNAFSITKYYHPKQVIFLHAWLPINDFHHLEFPLILENRSAKFIYTVCSKCEGIEEHGFPEINLRKSVDLSGVAEDKGALMYDNRVSPMHQDRETIEESYSSLQRLVEATRM